MKQKIISFYQIIVNFEYWKRGSYCIYVSLCIFFPPNRHFFLFLLFNLFIFQIYKVPMRYGFFCFEIWFPSTKKILSNWNYFMPILWNPQKISFRSVLFKITAHNSRFQESLALLKIQSLNVTTNFATKGVETRLWVARKLENTIDVSSEIVSRPSFDIRLYKDGWIVCSVYE